MATNYYYYLVSGAPDLLLDESSRGALPVRTIIEEVRNELAEEDFEIVRAMLLPIDNRNLVNMLEGGSAEFDDRGCYKRDELATAIRAFGDTLPEYMQAFLAAQRENRQLHPGMTPLDQLTWLYYDEMDESENEFVREWCTFDVNLRNVMVGVNLRKDLGHVQAISHDRPALNTLIGRGEAAEAVLRSTAPDFGMAASQPWVEKINALSRGNLTDMEKGIDEIKWGLLDDLVAELHFQAEWVAAFIQKLIITDRWMKLDPHIGQEKLMRLVDELMKSFVMPEGF